MWSGATQALLLRSLDLSLHWMHSSPCCCVYEGILPRGTTRDPPRGPRQAVTSGMTEASVTPMIGAEVVAGAARTSEGADIGTAAAMHARERGRGVEKQKRPAAAVSRTVEMMQSKTGRERGRGGTGTRRGAAVMETVASAAPAATGQDWMGPPGTHVMTGSPGGAATAALTSPEQGRTRQR